MSVDSEHPAIEIADNGDDADDTDGMVSLKHIALNDVNKIYVLTDTISISTAHSPIGTATQPFKGKLYGAGKTITLSVGFDAETAEDVGLFGYVNGALIRDLTVVYAGNPSIGSSGSPNSTAVYIGGIAGRAEGGTKISNCIARGAEETTSLSALSTSGTTAVGGITGLNGTLENCLAALNVEAEHQGSGILYVGGAVGLITNDSIPLLYITATGNVTVHRSVFGYLAVGGVVGQMNSNGGKMKGIRSSGTVTASNGPGSSPNPSINTSINGVGHITQVNLDDIEWNGKIVVPSTHTSQSITRIGGISSYYSGGVGRLYTANKCVGSGAIEYRGTKTTGDTIIGGLFGELLYRDADAKTITVSNSSYTGRIDVDNGTAAYTGILRLGGFAGSITKYCGTEGSSAAATITVSKSGGGAIYMGGFVGDCSGAELSNSHAAGSLTLLSAPTASEMNIGGFAGYAKLADGTVTKLSDCSASGDVNAEGINRLCIGGLLGNSNYPGSGTGYGVIESCFATGNVNAINTGTGLLYTGGLAGLGDSLDIIDSYALGDVFADRRGGANGAVSAGGLAGNVMYITSATAGSIERCFAAGSVTAQANNASSTIYAGGLVGQATNGSVTIDNSATLGAKVIATGGTARYVGRVTGGSTGTRTNCYAWNGMLTGDNAVYNAYVPGAIVSGGTATDKDGADAGTGDFKARSWWEKPSPAGADLGFTAANGWDHTYTVRDGRPGLIKP
jgi:hypothetical protein